MKHLTLTGWMFIAIALAVLIVILFAGKSAVDIQFYDTYFVIEKWLLALFTLVFVLFVLSLLVGIFSGFSNRIFNWLLFITGFCIVAYCIYLYLALKNG